jgi:hypothetical protein
MLPRALVLGLAALALAACSGGSKSTEPARLPATECGTNSGRGCVPPDKRVDLERPSFSHPTEITNPLFPISRLRSALLLGHVEGKPFRTETTLLPGTGTVLWDGRRVRVLVSQYMAYLDGRITEVALDRYAQADDGSVWYLGEDVFDYADGTVSSTEGTWLAGKEGPGAMIMPADPKVGNVYRTENAPGIVFEEVTIGAVDRTVGGPRGPVSGAIVARELHSDGSTENKVFAPGYGEFRTAGGGDLEALALAVPTDALSTPEPPALHTLMVGSTAILEASRAPDWPGATATLRRMQAAWKTLSATPLPPRVAARASESFDALVGAVRAEKPSRVAEAAIDFAQSALDLELQFGRPAEVDADRFRLWTQQLRVDAAANDLAGVTGAVAVLEWIRDRFAYTLAPDRRTALDAGLRDLRGATDARNLPAAADKAARLAAELRVR